MIVDVAEARAVDDELGDAAVGKRLRRKRRHVGVEAGDAQRLDEKSRRAEDGRDVAEVGRPPSGHRRTLEVEAVAGGLANARLLGVARRWTFDFLLPSRSSNVSCFVADGETKIS